MRRQPAVAGQFYRGTAEGLRQQVQGYPGSCRREGESPRGSCLPMPGSCIPAPLPGPSIRSIDLPDTFVLIGPNHTGLGAPVSLMTEGVLGDAARLRPDQMPPLPARSSPCPRASSEDSLAHLHEHSLEVQLPFIQYLKKEFTFVPIQMLDTRLETCLEVGRAWQRQLAERNVPGADRSQFRHEPL